VQALIGVRRTGGTSGPNPDGSGSVSVNFATSDGTATNGINYTGVNESVVFPPGEVLKLVPVPVMDDSNITPNLTVNLTLSGPTPPAILGDQPTATLTIINDDNAVKFSSDNFAVAKNTGTGFGTLDVQRIGTTNGSCTVDFYTSTNGTAVIGTDYQPTNGTLTFNPGDTDKTIYVPVINNGLVEGNRTVIVALTNNMGTLLNSPSNSTLTIDDTTAAPGQFYLSATNYQAGSGDGTVFLTVLRTNGTSGSASVTYTTVPGTAVPGIDYNPVTNTVSFGDGDTLKTFPITLINNPTAQEPVSFSVFLSNPTGLATLTTPTNATVTIVNTNSGVEFVSRTNAFIETAGTATLFVSRVGNTSGPLTVNFSTTNGTALAGQNFTAAVNAPLSFGSGEALKVISIPLIYDPMVTGDLLFTVGLASTNPAVQVTNPKFTTVVVHDADAGLSFTNATTSVLKTAGVAAIPVITSNTNVEPYSVNYATADGTAQANIHYTPVAGTLTFSNGVATNYFYVPILNNGIIDTNRYFTVQLSGATAPAQVVSPSVQTVTIVEAQSGFSFSSPAYSVLRNGGIAATITVNRQGNSNNVASVNFSATNGTAVAGLDYTPTNGVFVFTNGVMSQIFRVPVFGRTTVQPDDTVLLQLSNPTNAILSPPNAATLTIHDTSGSLVVPAGSVLTSESFVPPNGIIDPGETVTLQFAFRASGGTNIPNVVASLLATNGITSPSPASQNYGGLVVNGPSVYRPFSFTAVGTNSQQIAATFLLGNGVTNIGTAVFTYTLGQWTNVFFNTNIIYIQDDTIASPYPSAINVTGVGGTLIKATMTVTNLTHQTPSDIDMLLVSPGGADTMVMSHAGAQFSIKSVTLMFDDAATSSLPQNARIVTGTNKPTAYGSTPSFP
jgi:hypothetical protein